MKIHHREALLKAVSGSINRNLNEEASDRDVKFFVLPSFNDLYTGSVYKNFQTSKTEDIEIHDVRKLEKLLTNSNLAFLELLYSVEVDTFGYVEIKRLLEYRDRISTINLKSLFNSCFGMYRGQMRDLTKPNSETQKSMIAQHGYNITPQDSTLNRHGDQAGFVVARTYNAIRILERNSVGILTLDHNLGEDVDSVDLPYGYDLVKYFCEHRLGAERIYLHTDNSVGRKNMYEMLLAAQRRGFIGEQIEIYHYPITVNK